MNDSKRSGFTLVELLVVVVLSGMVAAAGLEILISNQRISTQQTIQVRAQQSVRAGMEILTSELREVSAGGGDLIAMGQTSFSIRAMGSFGIICGIDVTGTPKLTVRRIGGDFSPGDSILVFAEGPSGGSQDGVWLPGRISASSSSAACGAGVDAQAITLPGMSATLAANPVALGGPIRGISHVSFGLDSIQGQWYLARTPLGGIPEPFAGPLLSAVVGGLGFEYLDPLGVPTTVPTDVVQVRITVRAQSSPSGAAAIDPSDVLTSLVYLRN